MPLGNSDDDLFEDSRMSFGEHLEELRRVLVRSLYGLVIGCVIGFYFANDIVKFLQQPLNQAIGTFKIEQSMGKLEEENGFVPPEMAQRMKSQRMIPKTYLVDPGSIVQLIRENSPDALSDIDLTPYRYRADEFPDTAAEEILKRWANRDADDPQSGKLEYLWGMLDATEQDKFEAALIGQALQLT